WCRPSCRSHAATPNWMRRQTHRPTSRQNLCRERIGTPVAARRCPLAGATRRGDLMAKKQKTLDDLFHENAQRHLLRREEDPDRTSENGEGRAVRGVAGGVREA